MSETGLVKAGYRGKVRVTVAASMPGSKPTFGDATVKVIPSPPARSWWTLRCQDGGGDAPVALSGTAFSQENDRRYDAVTFSSSNAKVVQASPDGRLVAVAPGSATVMAKAGGATSNIPVTVVAGPVPK